MTILWVIIAMAVIHVVMDNRQPAKTMAWALVIIFVPVVGLVFYLFFGINHRKERMVSQPACRPVDETLHAGIRGAAEPAHPGTS